ncbi:MAG TPA: radical SAM protein [Spirochaetota bacterium]|nr:radical SAM protein [Spirochaetota bacterium]HPV97391.1 radical SAM protein [Spirochaetota bacterium]
MRSPFTPGIERPCHYRELFVTSGGSVYPCCLTWNNPALCIGHITDPDLEARILSFDGSCRCSSFRLRKGRLSDEREYKLNAETGLACNGRCAMCCVDAPSSAAPYIHYDELDRLVDTLPAINHLMVQGGEVLVQKKTMDWLRRLALRLPGLPLVIVTNGNVDTRMLGEVERLFFNVIVSIYGFQDETYRRITCMELEKTRRFAELLVTRKKTTVHLKYLITPLNIHELPLFLQWAACLGPETVSVIDSNSTLYMNRGTPDRYWDKIIERTGEKLRSLLAGESKRLRASSTVVLIDALSREMFGLDEGFLKDSGLEGTVLPNPMVG